MKRRTILLALLITLIYSTNTPALTFYIWKDRDDIVHIEDVRPEGTAKFEKIEIEEYSIDPSSAESADTRDDGADKTTPRKKEESGSAETLNNGADKTTSREKEEGEDKNFIRNFADNFIEFFRIPERDKEKDHLTTMQRNLDKYLKADEAKPKEKKE